jgi:hypothetical protein
MNYQAHQSKNTCYEYLVAHYRPFRHKISISDFQPSGQVADLVSKATLERCVLSLEERSMVILRNEGHCRTCCRSNKGEDDFKDLPDRHAHWSTSVCSFLPSNSNGFFDLA